MNLELVEKIANAVLYEGYILYPYRPSATKNQQRWNFGGVYPRKFSEANKGTDAWTMQTECLVSGDENTPVDIRVRFLQMVKREVGEPIADCGLRIADLEDDEKVSESDFQIVKFLEVGGKVFQTWQEAIERELKMPSFSLSELEEQTQQQTFTFPSNQESEVLRDENNKIAGVIVRKQEFISCEVKISAELVAEKLFKVTIRIFNQTPFEFGDNRDEGLMRAFVSTHKILSVRSGEFVSLLEPPTEFSKIAAECENIGTFPVLVGEEESRDCILSSPIILYDYPQVSPESAGDFFDGTEMDEMLTLRIMTLTDDEKNEMRGADERTRRMLERTETMPPEMMMKLHGVMRNLPPQKENDQ